MKSARPFVIAAVLAFLLWGTSGWVESPPGARFLSHWVTLQVQRQVPGTVVTIDQVRLRWPLSVKLRLVRWGKPGRPPILRLDWVVLSVDLSQWLKGHLVWNEEAQVGRIDLAALDQTLAQGEWKADGYLAGRNRFRGTGSVIQEADLQLRTLTSGGMLSSEILQRLLSMMPEGDARGKLLRAIQSKPIFHFDVGKIEVATEGPVYLFKFLLDGDHLLDITIRVSKESLGVLEQLVNERRMK